MYSPSDIFLMINLKFASFILQYDVAFWGAFVVIITAVLAIGKLLRGVNK